MKNNRAFFWTLIILSFISIRGLAANAERSPVGDKKAKSVSTKVGVQAKTKSSANTNVVTPALRKTVVKSIKPRQVRPK